MHLAQPLDFQKSVFVRTMRRRVTMTRHSEEEEKPSPPPKELQNFVVKSSAVVVTIFLTSFYLAFTYLPIPLPRSDSAGDRLMYTIRCLFLSSTAIIGGIHLVGNVRYNSKAINPLGGAEHLVDLPNRFLRNTMEQFFLHVISQLTLTTFLSHDSMKAVPILSAVFLIARIVYWIGYSRPTEARLYRAPGFGLTFLPTIMSYAFCAFCFVTSGPTYKI